jgi:FixJ family two-component response regulator
LRLASAFANGSDRKHCAQESIVAEKILFVDDEPLVLDAFRRMLHDKFEIYTVDGGEKALASARDNGPFAVVISDMRMPGMNGAEFLAKIRQKAPDTVRMLLTGFTDLDAAVAAVNEGNIFRFLTKPCRKDDLINAINLGLAHYRAAAKEKELVNKALTLERSPSDWDSLDNCRWDQTESPTGLPGPSQAKEFLTPLFGVDPQVYVVLLKLTMLQTIEERYGEVAAADYINHALQLLMQALRPGDRFFHWGRHVLMAVLRRKMPLGAVRMEVTRITSTCPEYLMEVNGRRTMMATSIAFEMLPVAQFTSLKEMLAAFDPHLSERREEKAAEER